MIWYPIVPRESHQESRKSSVALKKTASVGSMGRNMVIITNIAHGLDQGINNTQMIISTKILSVDAALSLESGFK